AAEPSRRKDEFFKMLSHELRNPLGPILNALEILNLVNPSEQAATDAREVLTRQAKHLSRLVDDLLDVYQITHGSVVLEREPLDFTAFVREAVERQRRALQTPASASAWRRRARRRGSTATVRGWGTWSRTCSSTRCASASRATWCACGWRRRGRPAGPGWWWR